MAEWVRCPKCRGEVGIPDNTTGSIHCPKCRELVYSVDPATQVKWKPEAPAPNWMKPWGYVFVGMGALGYISTVYVNWMDSAPFVSLFTGLLNPMVFIGLPLGFYWLSRSGELSKLNEPANNG